MSAPGVQVHTDVRDEAGLRGLILSSLPDEPHRRILIKPNWVKHEKDPRFPISALVTSPDLVRACLDACLEKYPQAFTITVADAPLQSCDWTRLMQQMGLDRWKERYGRYRRPAVRFTDLRREAYREVAGYLEPGRIDGGDPEGYREAVLDTVSFLEPISAYESRFRVSDYDVRTMLSRHRRGHHRYLVAGSVLGADLLLNVPKMKTHQKAGITGALKNLVGISGDKASLAHYRSGSRRGGSDEFPPGVPWSVWLQVRTRDRLQKRSRWAFGVARRAWLGLRRMNGIQVEGTPENLKRRFYVAGGAWYGNDTIWRMVYDLNRIARFVPPEGGRPVSTPQRAYVAVVDGLVAGEGNGPLQPLPVDLGVIVKGKDPFAVDWVMARLMGFDPMRIPILAHAQEFGDSEWGRFDPSNLPVGWNGKQLAGLHEVPVLRPFQPIPGWRGHIEASDAERRQWSD
jgi:uncharacterized protein (DUF362 family)